MSAEKTCIFCSGPVEDGEICSWCGFPQTSFQNLSGTLKYGTKTNIYVVGNVLTMDGESTSYLAYDTKNQRKVILKEFLPVSMVAPREGNTVKVQRGYEVLFKNLMMDFQDLYRVLSGIESKALQKIYDIYEENGTVYVALEYIKGDTIKQNLIKRGKPYTFKQARWMFQDLFEIVEKLEKINLAHGGISDENVIVTPENNLVLTGFAVRDLRVKNDHMVYKLYEGFSAPEQYKTGRFAGFYTDIYSLSALFYYTVTGNFYTDGALDMKDVHHLMPKYAIEALKYATELNPIDRIDNLNDFILMLDDKATIEKPVKITDEKKDKINLDKKYIIRIALVVILAVFAVTVGMIASNGNSEVTSTSMESSDSFLDELRVPRLVGRSYSDIINDEELNRYFYFEIEEDYSNEFAIGQIISHKPSIGEVVKPGTTIYLKVSKGSQLVEVPDGLVGQPIDYVTRRLDDLGIQYTIKEVVQSKEYPYGVVVGTDIQPGVKIDTKRQYVIIYVSDNTPIVETSPSPSPTPSPTPTPTPSPTPPSSSSPESSDVISDSTDNISSNSNIEGDN